jgi:DNA-directed RNA polymerase subunit K
LKGEKYTRYERARIVGARALQVFMGAPVLIDTKHTDPLEIALEEMNLGIIPITVKRDSNR